MIVYRIAKAAYVGLEGDGARLYGGRWNSPGRPMLYTAASPSLAVLEVLVHLDLPPELIPNDYRLLTIDIPEDAPTETLGDEPANPVAEGDAFLARQRAIALLVPSVVVPQERNVLINSLHPDAARIRVLVNEPYRFDPRLI